MSSTPTSAPDNPPPAWARVQNLKSNKRFLWLVGAAVALLALIGLFSMTSNESLSLPQSFRPSTAPTATTPPAPSTNKPPPLQGKKVGGKGVSADGRPTYTFEDGTVFEKPKDLVVHGFVFYGRWDRVQILDCYLKRNHVKNGGMIDKVVWMENTEVEEDRNALKHLIESEPEGYERRYHDKKEGYATLWNNLNKDILYIKMDDDTVWIGDDALPRLIQYRLTHVQPFIVSANVINNPALSWVHQRLGAIRPWLPELEVPGDLKLDPQATVSDWRASKLPSLQKQPTEEAAYDINDLHGPHRWLPVLPKDSETNNDFTPFTDSRYDAMGPNWRDFRIAAQEHMSFFQNLEGGTMSRYKFDTWDMHYARLSINFLAIWGRDVHIALPMYGDDEMHITQTIPRKLSRHAVFHGESLVVHYSFFTQLKGLQTTDILERYRALAKETCGSLMPLKFADAPPPSRQ